MPFVAPKSVAPASFRAVLGRAVGLASDFTALAYCPDLDRAERELHPDHDEFTHIIRYRPPERTIVGRYPRRLDGLWQRSDGTLLAVGTTQGVVEIGPSGMREVGLAKVPGIFSAVWGAGDEHVFAVGSVPAFAYYQQGGRWLRLPVPEGAADLRDVCGTSETDVYFVGDSGQVLHFDGRAVTALRVPVRRHLTAIARLADGRMCIGGYQGTLLVGNRARWRHVVTETADPLLSVATLGGRVYYAAEGSVWSTDGTASVAPELAFPARWVSGLGDALVVSHERDAKLYVGGTLTDLDLTL
jgi:hypothetical protein